MASYANVTFTSLDAAYVIVTNLTCAASMAGSLSVLILFLMYPDVRTTSRKLLVFLGGANFLQCIGGLMQAATYYNTGLLLDQRRYICESAAFASVMGQVASALWTCALTLYVFVVICLHGTIKTGHKLTIIFHIFCWMMPLAVAALADAADVYGSDQTNMLIYQHPAICWISDRVLNALDWNFITIEGWVIATYFLCLILFLFINCPNYCQKHEGKQGQANTDADSTDHAAVDHSSCHQMRYVPLIYCLLRVWGTAHFLFTQYPIRRHPRAFDWLLIFRAFGDNAQGLANCALFCITTPKIRRMITNGLSCCCACFCIWCKRQKRRLAEERWLPKPMMIVRMSKKISSKRCIDGSDLDISGISLELPSAEELESQIQIPEDEVWFER